MFVLVSCGVPPSAATFRAGTEALPGAGYFHVVGNPAAARRAVSIRSFGSDGEESRFNDTFAAGQIILFDGTGFPGPSGLTVNGIRCDGRIPIQLDLITDVVLDIRDDGCAVRVVGLRAVDEP